MKDKCFITEITNLKDKLNLGLQLWEQSFFFCDYWLENGKKVTKPDNFLLAGAETSSDETGNTMTLNLSSKLSAWTPVMPRSKHFWGRPSHSSLHTEISSFSSTNGRISLFQISIQTAKSLHLKKRHSNTGTVWAVLYEANPASIWLNETHSCTESNRNRATFLVNTWWRMAVLLCWLKEKGWKEERGSCFMQQQCLTRRDAERGQVFVRLSKLCSLYTLQWWSRKVSLYTRLDTWFIYTYFKPSISLQLRLPSVSSLLTSRLLNSIHAHFLSFERSVSYCRGCC